MEVDKIYHGNNIDILKTFPDDSIDSVVTDPPYGISFMNKHWDYDVPTVELWKEVYRVLKPGGHMLVACGTRTQHRMAVNIEDAGFEIRDIVAWIYGSGFPKSLDISKAIDNKLGAEREIIGNAVGAQSSSTGKYGGWGNDDGNGKSQYDITAPSTDQAKQYQGWGTALKPAMELWTLARKPTEGTIAENVLMYGTGGINIDGCRIPTNDFDGKSMTMPNHNQKNGEQGIYNATKIGAERLEYEQNNARFPANVTLSWYEDEYVLKNKVPKEIKREIMEWLYENA